MIEKEFVIKNKLGFHIKPINALVQRIIQYKSTVKIMKEDQMVDGKSVLEILSLCVAQNDKIKVIVDGEDEEEVIRVIKNFIEHEIFQYEHQE